MLKYGLIGLVALMVGGFPGPAPAYTEFIIQADQNLTTWRPGDTALMRFYCNTEKDLQDIIAVEGEEDRRTMGNAKIEDGSCMLGPYRIPIVLKRWVAGPFTDADGESSIWAFGNEENEWFMWLMDNTGPN